MTNKENNIAYLDGANLHKGVTSFGWELDYTRFRVWLKEKYGVEHAYIFIGLVPKYKDLYAYLQEAGFTLIFKEVIYDGNGKAKGNCDADLVVSAMQDTYEKQYGNVLLVSSDGDYTPLVKFLISKDKMLAVLSPYDTKRCSVLLKRTGVSISYINDQRSILELKNEKAPNADGTAPGSPS